ncbi:tyrosine-type recombinase/integrase [Streptomyces mirabilis]|uniref:tyrosine-type recombinase/integrase n=1 Tax=Streptomyces mirabilis TaxID=68239 RepID=UPI0033BF7ED2
MSGRPTPAATAPRSAAPSAPEVATLLERFPPRPPEPTWPATRHSRSRILERLLAPPFISESERNQEGREAGLIKVLDWLEDQPGDTWQERWLASGAEQAGNVAWRQTTSRVLRGSEWTGQAPWGEFIQLGRGLLPLLAADVIRPSLAWMFTPGSIKNLIGEMARGRDADGFAKLAALAQEDPANANTKEAALRRIAGLLAAKGGTVADIAVGDCLQVVHIMAARGRRDTSLYFYQMLHALGVFPATAPRTVRVFAAQGQVGIEGLIDRYDLACSPIRDLLVAYLRERQPALDYATLRSMSFGLGRMFWKDLEMHHPGISSLHLEPDVAAAWKHRVARKTLTVTNPDGTTSQTEAPRADLGMNYMSMVRAFYLDIAQWAMEDPPTWGPWAAPCPIRDAEMSRRKVHAHRKSRMDQRTRERLPALPALVTAADTARKAAAERLAAAQQTPPGQLFTAGGQTLRRAVLSKHTRAAKIWAEDPDTGKRRDLTLEEHRAFWSWAAVEVLRHTGIRVEELAELSHHSLVQYRLPTTGELVPLLQIAPSKTDAERLLVISPELADVLSAIISRVRGSKPTLPLVVSYDIHERVWNPPMPLLFQQRHGVENRPITIHTVRALLNATLAATGLTDGSGRPLNYTPHDFRRIFITDAILNGMPPHIAQLVAGHKAITTTMGYKAVYPEEVINGHRAFIARRRATRPGEEYRVPTEKEWDDFLGHFERRKVAHGTCGRAFGTACIHEHACIRCALLRPDPAQHHRLAEVRDNLLARIAEAEHEGWRGEVEGLRVSLAGAEQKLAQAEQIATRHTTIDLGMPDFSRIAGRHVT